MKYRFPSFDEAVKYDVFFERVGIEEKILPELTGRKVLDLYGNRDSYGNAEYIISTKSLPYKVIRTLQLRYRPVEINCLMPADGEGIFVYDVKAPDTAPTVKTDILTRYDIRSIPWRKTLHIGWSGFLDAVLSKVQRGKK